MSMESDYIKGYLYSTWSGQLRVMEGRVRKCYWTLGKPQGTFICDGTPLTEEGRYQCSSIPGVILNKVVWLEERDDELAKSILIEYEEQCIAKLKKKIENHEHIINIIKGS